MKSCKDLIKDEGYRNWVKGTLGIEETSKAICEYVNKKFSWYLQGSATLNNPATQSYLTDEERSHFEDELSSELRQKLAKLVKFEKNQLQWMQSPQKVCLKCKSTFEKLLSLHKGTHSKDIHLKNCNDTRSLTPEWAIAKIFMPMGNEKNKGPDDTDPSAVFILMTMCDLFTNPIKDGNLTGVRDARNAFFHSSDNLVAKNDLDKYFGRMENLLADALNDSQNDNELKQTITEGLAKIKKLNESEMTMTLFEDAQRAIRIQRTAIYYDFEQRLCENDPDQLRELLKLAEKLGSDLEFLNNQFDNIKTQNERIGELEKALVDKNNEIEQLNILRSYQESEIERLNTELRNQEAEIMALKKDLKEDKVKIGILEVKSKKMSKENNEKEKEIANMKLKTQDLEKKLNEVAKVKEKMKEEIANKNVFIRDLENKLCEEKKENYEMQNVIANKSLSIRNLEIQLSEGEKTTDKMQEEIDNKNVSIQNLEKKLRQREEENKQIQKEIAKNNVSVRDLKEKLSERVKEKDEMQKEIEQLRCNIDFLEWEKQLLLLVGLLSHQHFFFSYMT